MSIQRRQAMLQRYWMCFTTTQKESFPTMEHLYAALLLQILVISVPTSAFTVIGSAVGHAPALSNVRMVELENNAVNVQDAGDVSMGEKQDDVKIAEERQYVPMASRGHHVNHVEVRMTCAFISRLLHFHYFISIVHLFRNIFLQA